MKIYFNIQALRAVAAMFVLWAHMREFFPNVTMIQYLPTGLMGVDLFFVISGFIIVSSTQNSGKTAVEFFKNRFLRIAPLYYLFTILISIVAVILPHLFKSSGSDISQLAKSLFFIPFEKTPLRVYPTYYLGWTLNYEMFFYAIFSIGIFASHKYRVLITICTVGLFTALGFSLPNIYNYSVILFVFTRDIMLDFIFGMIIAIVWMSDKRKLNAALVYTLVFVSILVGVSLDRNFLGEINYDINPNADTAILNGIPAAIIVAAAVMLEKSGWVLKNNFVQLMGDCSYSLYLSHFLVVAAMIAIANHFEFNNIERVFLSIATAVLCICVGILLHNHVEKPLMKYLGRRNAKPALVTI